MHHALSIRKSLTSYGTAYLSVQRRLTSSVEIRPETQGCRYRVRGRLAKIVAWVRSRQQEIYTNGPPNRHASATASVLSMDFVDQDKLQLMLHGIDRQPRVVCNVLTCIGSLRRIVFCEEKRARQMAYIATFHAAQRAVRASSI
jgi:hypothetical protein